MLIRFVWNADISKAASAAQNALLMLILKIHPLRIPNAGSYSKNCLTRLNLELEILLVYLFNPVDGFKDEVFGGLVQGEDFQGLTFQRFTKHPQASQIG